MVATNAAVEPNGSSEDRLLVITQEASSVELRDASSLRPLAHLKVRAMPHEVAVNQHTRLAYLCISYEDGFYNHYNKASHYLEIVDVDTLDHVRSIDLSPHWGPHGISLSPDLSKAFVTCESNGGEVIVVDLGQEKVISSVSVGAHGPHWMTMVPDGTKIFTANKEDAFVTVVDVASMTAVDRIQTPHGTEQIATAPDGARVYIASQRSPELYIVSAHDHRVEQTIELDDGPGAVCVTPDGRFVLFTSFNFTYWEQPPVLRPGFFQVLDTASLDLGPRVPVGRFPLNVVASADSHAAYVSNYKDNSVSIVDLRDMSVATTVPVGDGPHGLVYLEGAKG
ncbi:hypothetical protein acdb102_23210 [Acidothermaceae bacterium B102]|nr:hypothetical protein acdb102_23210 [Acidothermaceae bacterium B102]